MIFWTEKIQVKMKKLGNEKMMNLFTFQKLDEFKKI